MRITLIIILILFSVYLNAQNEALSNNRIGTSWGYNVHLYKGMFDFKPGEIDVSASNYPWFNYSYVNFKFASNIGFNTDYRLSKTICVTLGINLYSNFYSVKANREFIDTLSIFNSEDYLDRGYYWENVIYIPVGLKYRYNNITISAGLINPILGLQYRKTLYAKSGITDKRLDWRSYLEERFFSSSLYIQIAMDELFYVKNYVGGVTVGYNNISSFIPYQSFTLGLVVSRFK